MKNFKSLFALSCLLVFSFLSFSCSDDDKDNDGDTQETFDPLKDNHFDIWVSLDKTYLVRSVKSLDDVDQVIDFKNEGVDVTAKIFQESAIKGNKYYQVPKAKDRYGKYQISSNEVLTIKEVTFSDKHSFLDRRYAHTWLNDNTLLFIAANGDKTGIIWTKLKADDMTILAEGSLEFPEDAPQIVQFSTSGLVSYRKDDNKILYSYVDNKNKTRFYMAFINADDMKVEKIVTEDRMESMGATAYGELLQPKSFFDAKGDFYLVCSNVIPGAPSTTQQYSALLRIKKGATDFDKTYIGYLNPSNKKGKILTAELLNDKEALLYIMDPDYTGAEGWGRDYNCYYAILDIDKDKITVLDTPFSEGNLSQLSVIVGNKAYLGVNPKEGNPCFYIYDIPTGKLTQGSKIQEGYSFERVVKLFN